MTTKKIKSEEIINEYTFDGVRTTVIETTYEDGTTLTNSSNSLVDVDKIDPWNINNSQNTP